MRHWLGQSKEDVAGWLASAGQPRFRAQQLWRWFHINRISDLQRAANLPKALRQAVDGDGVLRALEEKERLDASDGLTSKWLYTASDPAADALAETVLIVEKSENRRTVCVSSMSGCPLGCAFCATGRHGFTRNLSAGEIVEQVYRADAFTRESRQAGVSHVVYMGMGEPLLNLDAVLRSAAIITDCDGMNLSGRHLTISTAGVPEGIDRLTSEEIPYRLALSLHAPNQAVREKIMPCATRWPLADVLAALHRFNRVASRSITFEYCLIDGVNASPVHARELSGIVRDFRGKVNLIPMNPVPGVPFRPPAAAVIRAFQEELDRAGVPVTVRMEKGAEIGAACGQLRAARAGGTP